MTKTLLRAGATLSLLVLLSPLAVHAAVDRAVMEGIGSGPVPGTLFACAHYMDGSTEANIYCSTVPIGSAKTVQDVIDSATTAVTSDATGLGYTLTNGLVWPFQSPNQVNALIASATSSLATVARTGSYNDLTNKPSTVLGTTTYAYPTRSLNSTFQVSTTSATIVSYTVDIGTSLSLSGGTTGTVTLQYADDSGFTTNVKTVQSSVNGNTGTLTVGLALSQTATASLNGVIPANKYVKLVTANTTGTPTFTFRSAQEVGLPF